jgi:flagellar hook-length control protein FliK
VALDSILNTPVIPAPPKSAKATSNPLGSLTSGSSSDHSAAPSHGATTGASGSNDSSSGNSSAHSATRDGSSGSKSSSTKGSSAAKSTQQPQGNAKSKQNAAAQQSQQSNAAAKASNAQGAVKTNQQQAQPTGPSFLEALAKTQADAADAATATAAPEVVTEPEAKAKKEDDKDKDPSSALTFIPQSVAALINVTPQQPPTPALGASTGDADGGDDAVSLDTNRGGGSSSAMQALTASLAKDTADGLKAAGIDAKDASSAAQTTDANSNNAANATNASNTISAFQSQMSVSSHFQQVTGADNSDKINSTVGTQAFQDEVGGKITWMANQGIQSANLQLSPEHMGPVSVHISVTDGSASVAINAAHPDTRAALEQALPKLREMFSTNGITLSDANVSHQSPRQQQQNKSVSGISGVRGTGGGTSDDSTSSSTVTSIRANVRGLVDTYA